METLRCQCCCPTVFLGSSTPRHKSGHKSASKLPQNRQKVTGVAAVWTAAWPPISTFHTKVAHTLKNFQICRIIFVVHIPRKNKSIDLVTHNINSSPTDGLESWTLQHPSVLASVSAGGESTSTDRTDID